MLEMVDGDRHLAFAQAQKSPHANDGIRDGTIGRDDEVIHLPDLFILVIVDGLPENLFRCAPATGDGLEFLHRYACRGRARNLRGDVSDRDDQHHPHQYRGNRVVHVDAPCLQHVRWERP